MATYKIENKGSRTRGFAVRGGIEGVKPGKTRTLKLRDELDDAAIEQLKTVGITASKAGDDEAENKVESRSIRQKPKAASDPAETGGVVPQSSVSEKGGVDRKDGDTTTTTKPTTKQTGPVA